jgi:PBSX family phage terminase large subunit
MKMHRKYKPLWTTECFITIVTGGRGSGKSHAVGAFSENLSFEKGHKILFTRYILHTAGDSIIPEFESKIDAFGHNGHFYITKSDIVNKASGTEILFRGIKTSSGNQTAKLKSIEGLTTWVLDEAEELDDEATFNTIMQSIRKKGIQNRIILILNPKSNQHWIYKRFFEDPGVDPKFNGEKNGVCYIYTNYLENLENLSPEFIAEAEKCRINNPALYRYDYLGEWVLSIEGAFLPMDQIKRYKSINEEGAVIGYFDTADEGTDHFAGPFGRLVEKRLYIFDAVFNQVNLTINEDVCTNRIKDHKVDRLYIESNSSGAYFIRNLREMNDGVFIRGVNNRVKKLSRILNMSGWILENVYFPEKPSDELYRFMVQMCSVTPESKDNDDAADAMAGLAQMVRRDLTFN